MARPSVCIIIPAYNEEASLPRVLASVRNMKISYDVIVVDDGSTDNTADVARDMGVSVLNHPINRGTGAAVQTGIKYVQTQGYDLAIQLDGDGQHDPCYIPQLIEVLKTGVDLAIGSRFVNKTKYKTPYLRRVGILFLSFLIRLGVGRIILDPTSGYRAFNKKSLSFLADANLNHFSEPFVALKLLKNDFSIKEVPVEMKARYAGKSSLTPTKAIILMITISFLILLEMFKKE